MSPKREIFWENPPGPDSGFYLNETQGRRTTTLYYPGRGLTSIQDAARILDIHPTTIYRWIQDHEVRAVKRDDTWRIPNSELKRLLRERPHLHGREQESDGFEE
jgi:excisionase family DNA binding protein